MEGLDALKHGGYLVSDECGQHKRKDGFLVGNALEN